MAYQPPEELFPDYLSRHTVLFNGELLEYLGWILISIINKTTVTGIIAAVAILLTWLYYLFSVDIFSKTKLINLLLCFLSGLVAVILIMLFNDLHDNLFSWSMNGEFWNDLFYSIIVIGIPEESAKAIPLLILLAFKGKLKEPIHYILYASANALGFAFVENLLYFQTATSGIIHGRAYFSVIGHMVFTSIVAYGFVLSRFKYHRRNHFVLVIMCLVIASTAHALYDFLLFMNLKFIFYLYFIFMIQVWIIMLNNCLNNSSQFSYRKSGKTEHSRLVMTIALASILALEYLMVGFSEGSERANYELISNIPFGGFLIVFFSSNLSSFNFIKGYWRDVYFSSRKKRGYGTLSSGSLLSSWYFVNAIRPHNYVGFRIRLTNDPFNHTLAEVMEGHYDGIILDKIILSEKGDLDPHWFIIKFDDPIPFTTDHQKYALIKLRNQNDSLLSDDEIQVFFKAIPEIQLLKTNNPRKEDFPFYGWALISRVN